MKGPVHTGRKRTRKRLKKIRIQTSKKMFAFARCEWVLTVSTGRSKAPLRAPTFHKAASTLYCAKNSKKSFKINENFGQRRQWRIQDFPEEGAPTPQRGRQHKILPKFPKNCMKSKEFGPGGGRTSPVPPLDPPLAGLHA